LASQLFLAAAKNPPLFFSPFFSLYAAQQHFFRIKSKIFHFAHLKTIGFALSHVALARVYKRKKKERLLSFLRIIS
jgi:hypothetical protein